MTEGESPWSPLRQPLFRRLWAAQLCSNVGSWIQSVAAVWLMLTLSSSSVLVALVQTASTLPIFLLGLPAGALADVVDRRRLLIVTEVWMLACAAALGVTAALDVATPALLLGLTFGLGAGVALNQPAWQAIQPELVPEDELPQAVALGGVSINLGRAVGPAVGGALVVAAGADVAFLVNAVSYLGVLIVLIAWRREPRSAPLPGERVLDAVQTGLRYARYAPALRAVLVRTVLFAVPASAIFALLPVVARDELDLGAQGYGLLVGAFGVGAVGAAVLLPRLRRRLPLDAIVAGATLALALVVLCIAFVTLVGLVAAALVAGGLVWLLAISSLNVAAQFSVPAWVRGRGLSVYLLLFAGGMALGSAVWGIVAEAAGTEVALGAAAAALAVGTLATLPLPARDQRAARPPAGAAPAGARHAHGRGGRRWAGARDSSTTACRPRTPPSSERRCAASSACGAAPARGAGACTRSPRSPSASWRRSSSTRGTSTDASTRASRAATVGSRSAATDCWRRARRRRFGTTCRQTTRRIVRRPALERAS